MIAPTRRSIFRLSSNSTCRNHAVDVRYLALQRVSAIFAALSSSSRPIPSQTINSISSYRRYATTTTKAVSRPKAHTGRTTSTTKKSAAKKPATKTVEKPSKTKAKKTAVKPKAKSKSKSKTKAKPKTRSKTRSKAKKPVKRNVKRRTKKPLTEKEAKNKKIRELKAKALHYPKQQPASAWLVFSNNYLKENKKPGEKIPGVMKEAAAKYKNIIPEEREHWNHLANQHKAANKATLKNWLESHSVEEIAKAQHARLYLRRLGVRGHYSILLHDARRPKRPVGPLNQFIRTRLASGDFQGIVIQDRFKLISAEYAKLSAAEREPYEALARQTSEDYAAAKQLQREASKKS